MRGLAPELTLPPKPGSGVIDLIDWGIAPRLLYRPFLGAGPELTIPPKPTFGLLCIIDEPMGPIDLPDGRALFFDIPGFIG